MTERPRLRRIGPPAMRQINIGARVQQAGALAAERARTARRSAKPTLAFYGSAEWKSLMRGVIAKRGRRCQDTKCKTPNRGHGGKVYGDHVVELSDGGAPLDEDNVMLRCATCHGRKTAEARRDRQVGGGRLRNIPGGQSTAHKDLPLRAARPPPLILGGKNHR